MDVAKELSELFTLHGFASLVILSVLELVLGIDNIIFISLVIAKLPLEKRLAARAIGLGLALVMRVAMLFGLVWLSKITTTLFTISGFAVTVRDALFFAGGAYLIGNTVEELKEHLSGAKGEATTDTKHVLLRTAILQIVMVDMLFSFDSIFTAIGLMQNFIIMGSAIVIGMICMLIVSGAISAFINKHPRIKTIALSFIIAVGLLLVTSAFHLELPKKYIYLAFFTAFAAELVNMRIKRSRQK